MSFTYDYSFKTKLRYFDTNKEERNEINNIGYGKE